MRKKFQKIHKKKIFFEDFLRIISQMVGPGELTVLNTNINLTLNQNLDILLTATAPPANYSRTPNNPELYADAYDLPHSRQPNNKVWQPKSTTASNSIIIETFAKISNFKPDIIRNSVESLREKVFDHTISDFKIFRLFVFAFKLQRNPQFIIFFFLKLKWIRLSQLSFSV